MKKFLSPLLLLLPAVISAQTLNNIPPKGPDPAAGAPASRALVSQRIPRLPLEGPFVDSLANTVWMAADLKRGEDFYLFFQNGTHSVALSKRGATPKYPEKSYPLKTVSENPEDGSAIVIVASHNRLLYYSFKLISPYYLAISAGYETAEALQELSISDYFNSGYVLQLVY